MRCIWIAVTAFSLIALGCSDSPTGENSESTSANEPEAVESIDFTDWPLSNSGTISKPKYGQGCRYNAVDGEVWERAADGDNDRLTLVESASGEATLTLYSMEGVTSVMLATVDFGERHLVGKAYYEATGSLQFGPELGEMWTVVDGTLCFEVSVLKKSCTQDLDCPGGQPCVANACATGDVAGEFSLIAEEDAGEGLRTVGGRFILSEAAIGGADTLNVNDDAIALDIP